MLQMQRKFSARTRVNFACLSTELSSPFLWTGDSGFSGEEIKAISSGGHHLASSRHGSCWGILLLWRWTDPIKWGERVHCLQIPGNPIKRFSLLCLMVLLSPCGKTGATAPGTKGSVYPVNPPLLSTHGVHSLYQARIDFKRPLPSGTHKINGDILPSGNSQCQGRNSDWGRAQLQI